MNIETKVRRLNQPARIASLLLLAAVVVLGNGCATSMTLDKATAKTYTYDQFRFVERAYRSPQNELLLCTSGTLAGGAAARPYTIAVRRDESRATAVVRAADRRITAVEIEPTAKVPRSAIAQGWPSAADVERKRLVPVPIAPAILPRATFNNPVSITEAVRSLDIREEAIVNFGGLAPFGFASVRAQQRGETVQLTPYFLDPKSHHRGLPTLLLLPLAVACDAVLIPLGAGAFIVVVPTLAMMGH